MEETTENFSQVETKTDHPTSTSTSSTSATSTTSTSASRTGKKIKRPTRSSTTSSTTEKVTKIKNPGRVDDGKNLALWNKLQKERLLQCRSSKEHTEQKEQKEEETKKQSTHSTSSACCVSHTSKLLGFATGVSIVGYIFYKYVNTNYKRTKTSAQPLSLAQQSLAQQTQEKPKSTSSGEITIKKESDPFQMQ